MIEPETDVVDDLRRELRFYEDYGMQLEMEGKRVEAAQFSEWARVTLLRMALLGVADDARRSLAATVNAAELLSLSDALSRCALTQRILRTLEMGPAFEHADIDGSLTWSACWLAAGWVGANGYVEALLLCDALSQAPASWPWPSFMPKCATAGCVNPRHRTPALEASSDEGTAAILDVFASFHGGRTMASPH